MHLAARETAVTKLKGDWSTLPATSELFYNFGYDRRRDVTYTPRRIAVLRLLPCFFVLQQRKMVMGRIEERFLDVPAAMPGTIY